MACLFTEIGTTRCQILRLKCTKFDFGRGCPPAANSGYAYDWQWHEFFTQITIAMNWTAL